MHKVLVVRANGIKNINMTTLFISLIHASDTTFERLITFYQYRP